MLQRSAGSGRQNMVGRQDQQKARGGGKAFNNRVKTLTLWVPFHENPYLYKN